jgi:peptidoglycan/xylan/chitin deacetylase (PgdA/CDA1 family)
MNKFKLKYFIASIISKLRAKEQNNDHRVLMYHSIYEVLQDRVDHFSVKLEVFKAHMKYIKSSGIKVVHFGELPESESSISITFDDGFKDNLVLVAPIMEKLKLPWTIFMVSDYLDKSSPTFLSESEIIELSKFEYVQIGGHGKTHSPLARLSIEESKEELLECKLSLEKIINKKITTMSFPHGSFTKEIVSQASDLGYTAIGNSVALPVFENEKIFLNRIAIYDYDSVDILKGKISGKWDWMGRRML